jgi:amino acid adenylation domain-containing protein
MSSFAERVAGLSPKRQELLARFLEQERIDVSRINIAPRKLGPANVPLSFAQERLWFLDQLEPNRPIYNLPDSHYFKGALDLEALERSLSEIVRRHEVLRTTFQIVDGEPVQVIASPQPMALEVIDLSASPLAERETEAQRLANKEAQRPFDLSRGPLFRVRLVRLAETEHVLLLTMHHIISDGWSLGVMAREMGVLYEAYKAGQSSPLAELPIQYADFAVWQREWLQGEMLEQQLGYWRQQLGGELPELELPMDRPRPARQSYRGAGAAIEVSDEVRLRLKEIGREGGATLFMTLLAAFKVLLWRYSRLDEILVGTPIANRNRAETESLIGFFVNTLVLRTKLRGEETFRELLEQVRETTLGAYEHQDVPFEKLVEELQPERNLSRQPLFQVMFALNEYKDLELAGLEQTWMQTEIRIVKFDMTVSMVAGEDYIGGALIYNIDLFNADSIRRMIRHFQLVLESIAANPDQRLSELLLLSPAEHQMLTTWNDTKHEYPQACLQDLFQTQVARTPEAVALVFKEESLSYRELNCRANQLAHHLRRLGVGPEVLTGILLERSVELIVGILGVLKAGGAFVPLDPAYPKERLSFMLEDAGLSVLLTQQSLLATLPAAEQLNTVCLDSETEPSVVAPGRHRTDGATGQDIPGATALGSDDLETTTTPDNLAYVIYTSGSTGQPKGVLIQHRGVSNLAFAQQDAFEISSESRVLQFASISFDAAVSEIFKTLLAGATLCLAAPESLLPVDPLIKFLRAQAITTVTFPPSVWAVLPSEGLPSLHTAISAGEACTQQIAAAWGRDGRRCLNAYGPTEVTVCATISDPLEGDGKPPVGRPIANTQVHVLDANLRPVPVRVAGELYVSGVGLARGYLRRPALTAERFIPDPFATQPGARLYRTGDLCRYKQDGNLEYVGRVDQQVKIRGFRIEPGEIESAIVQHPSVRDALVIAREDTPGDKRLVAYLITEPGGTADVSQWRAWLLQKLPEHMLPSAFVSLPELPLTPNGKVNRSALPAPDAARPEQGHAYLAPRDQLEQFLVDLWQPALGLKQIGVNDNFFEIGGNSLKGAILINRLQELLGEYVYVVAIFDAPTIADLANYLRKHYPEAVNRICGAPASAPGAVRNQITAAQIAEFKQIIPPLPDMPADAATAKNPAAIFVLSPPRSGSTLMRVMLAGHPQLFAPPELELLSFNTLAERRKAFADRFSFWREGTIRALMEIKQCDADAATRLMEEGEEQQLTTKEFYGLLQGLLGERVLVDKTPSYALDLEILRRAESDFEGTRYIHLIRHPYAMIRSFVKARLEQVFFRHAHNFSRRELAELVWVVSQMNILKFLETVPAERQFKVHFEELVNEPERVLRGVCEFLRLKYVSEMATPYQGSSERMTNGIHPLSKMLGDVKFHEHRTVEPGIADRWQQELTAGDLLAEETWTIAELLGYSRTRVKQSVPAGHSELRPIGRVDRGRDAGFPLSFAQQRLWVIDQLEPGSSAYNIPLAEEISGPLNVSALERSFNELVRRHESLRTTFTISDGQPVQVISEPYPLRLEVTDLSRLPEAERESEAERQVHDEAQRPFDLIHGPLLRVRLLRLEEEEHLLLLTMHHIVSDGWSMEVFVRELTTLYDSFVADRPSPLPELPLQYVDFALWQREWLKGDVLEQQLAYWKQQLGGTLPVLALPLDRPRPPVRSTRTSHEAVIISEDVKAALKQIAQQESATMFMTLLATFNLLLARLSGQTDVLVGTPAAGRSRAELEGLIGFFVNTLVLRTDLSGDPTFRELVQRVRSAALGAYKYQDFPFEKLVDELKPDRDPSFTPLFQVMFLFENVSEGESQASGLQFTPAHAENESGKFDLTLGMKESTDELVAVLRYNTELFNDTTVKRFLGCFETLLNGIAEDAERRISQFELLNSAERSELIEQWNQTPVAYPVRSAQQLFEDQVAKRGEATALVFENRQLSYRELNARANQVAHYLRGLGVGPEVLVGVCVERSIEMIAGVLGVLKAGGAFVPLDPNYPQERIAFMLDDAGLSILLTQERLRERIPGRADLIKVYLDTDWPVIETLPDQNPDVPVMPDNLAYAIYTSGSTGQPKGVLLHHRGLTNLALAQAEAFAVSASSRVLQFASFSFDATVSEIFKTLASGATLCIATAESLMPVTLLLELLRQQRITMATLPPSVLAILPNTNLPDLRTVISAGEACSIDVAASWSSNGFRFLNAYGPTEVTVCATTSEILDGICKPPIGRPIANAEAYVLDANFQPVPVGVIGELYIGGAGVARGYLRRPELTAERFVPHPFSNEPGRRLYRTGDLACFREDGQLDYRGRIDQQVKMRGFRIELGEIETVLAQHPDVRDVVILAREDTAGDKRLVAYVVSASDTAPDVNEWRAWLSRKLPDYMIPSAFVSMEAFPLTGNQKIDRAALPDLDGSRPSQNQAYIAPRDQLEQLLVDVWQPVLGLDELGVHDNFFQIGGDSIKGAILINRLQELLGEYVYVVAIFDAPTVAQLANYLRRHYSTAVNRVCDLATADRRRSRELSAVREWSPLVELQRGDGRPPLYFVHPVGGNVFCYAELAHHLGSEQSFYGLQSFGLAEGQSTLTGISEMAALYLEAIFRVQAEGPYLLGGWSMGGLVAFEMAQQLQDAGHEVGLLALVDTHSPAVLKQTTETDDEKLWVQFQSDMTALYGLEQSDSDSDQLKRLFQIFSMNVRAMMRYELKRYTGRITYFRASSRLAAELPCDPIEEWRTLAAQGVEVHMIPGNHYTMLTEPSVQVMADWLRTCLSHKEARKAQTN